MLELSVRVLFAECIIWEKDILYSLESFSSLRRNSVNYFTQR